MYDIFYDYKIYNEKGVFFLYGIFFSVFGMRLKRNNVYCYIWVFGMLFLFLEIFGEDLY